MKNKEKFAKEIVEAVGGYIAVHKIIGEIAHCFENVLCKDCIFYQKNVGCIGSFEEWANAEYKEPKRFTEREKKFIWLNWDCNYVQRTLHGQLWFYSKRPRSNESISGLLFAYPQKILDFLNIPFEGIKEGETVSREEILGGNDE